MSSISRKCPICKKEHAVEFQATQKTMVKNMGKAEKELDRKIEACDHK